MKVVWTDQAKNSLAQIYDYIIRNRPEYADFVIDAILKKADTLNDKRIDYPKDPNINKEKFRVTLQWNYKIEPTLKSPF